MIDEDILNHGRSYIDKDDYEKAAKVFRMKKEFKKGSENDEMRKTLLAFCLFNLGEIEETIEIAKTVKSQSILCKELASSLICNSLLILGRYEEGFAIMNAYLKTHEPLLYLRTISILLKDISEGIIEDKKIIREVQELALEYNVSLK